MNAGMNVVYGQFGVVVEDDLGKGKPFFEQINDCLNKNCRADNTRFTELDIGVNDDSFLHCFNFINGKRLIITGSFRLVFSSEPI